MNDNRKLEKLSMTYFITKIFFAYKIALFSGYLGPSFISKATKLPGLFKYFGCPFQGD